jgi:hypothetical protein
MKRTLALGLLVIAAVGWGEFRLARFKAELANEVVTRQVSVLGHNPDAIVVGDLEDEPFVRIGTTKDGANVDLFDAGRKLAVRASTGQHTPFVEAIHPLNGEAVGLHAAPGIEDLNGEVDAAKLAVPFQPIPGGMR